MNLVFFDKDNFEPVFLFFVYLGLGSKDFGRSLDLALTLDFGRRLGGATMREVAVVRLALRYGLVNFRRGFWFDLIKSCGMVS